LHPRIWGWEALARDTLSNKEDPKAPFILFKTAEQWGVRFQVELDLYFLDKAITTYTTEKPSTRRIDDLKPLTINIYPESLIRTSYHQELLRILNQGKISMDLIHLEISEKTPIPKSNNPHVQDEEMVEFIEVINKLSKLAVKFVIDDFGVGYASTSRLTRLKPAIIKIDRDALLHPLGRYTIRYTVELAKNIGGDMMIVVEGFEKGSMITIRELWEYGIHYIQGHLYGPAIPVSELDRMSLEVFNNIRQAFNNG